MFLTRLISGIVLVLIALAVIITGGPVLFAVTLILSLIGMNEMYKAAMKEEQQTSPVFIICYIGAVVYYAVLWFNLENLIPAVICLVLGGVMCAYVFCWPRYKSEQVMTAFFGVIYVAVMLSFIYRTRILENGQYIVWLIFLCSWGCDTCAYCAGRLFGKHKMAPTLSPKKTIEGAVGGVIGAAILGVLYALFAGKCMNMTAPCFEYAVICAAGSLFSMVGDLAASAIKRNHDIKDYGKLIPGHGGILDRFDSVIFTAPVIWLLAVVIL